jgi:hypothetical protein
MRLAFGATGSGPRAMNPARRACVALAASLWREQSGLSLLEASNEVRVRLRALRDPAIGKVPGVEAIAQWLVDAIAAGELVEPEGLHKRNRSQRQRRKT